MFDSHCHIHEPDFPGGSVPALERAFEAGIVGVICIGTSQKTSQQAVDFANQHENVWAAVGVHPHDSTEGDAAIEILNDLITIDRNSTLPRKIVAIGEIGLDYYYNHSPRESQIYLLKRQLDLAERYNLAVSFHVRDAFEDFWPIVDEYSLPRAVVHSFTDNARQLETILAKGWFVGINGISTFTKSADQLQVFDFVPLDRMLLETDAPFLTPSPLRGKVNEPAFIEHVANFHAERRKISVDYLISETTNNTRKLFELFVN